jgi:hypothetical protein
MVRVQQLTAEVLLSDPRRGPAVPNRDGTHALYTVSAHVLGGKTRQEVRILNIETGKSTQLSSDPLVHDALWIPSAKLDIIYLRSAETGRTQVLVASAADVSAEHYLAAEIDAPVSNLKLRALDNGSVAFVVTALVGESGLYNQEAAQRGSTARVFDTEIPIVESLPSYLGHLRMLTGACSGMPRAGPTDAASGTTSWRFATVAGSFKGSSSICLTT